MKLIIILISLAIERYLGLKISNRMLKYFKAYHQFFDAKFSERDNWGGMGLLLMMLLPLIVGAWFIQWLTQDWIYGVVEIIFGVLVLLTCMQSAKNTRSIREKEDRCFRL